MRQFTEKQPSLLDIAKQAKDQATLLAPYSSNKSRNTATNFHREFLVNALRTRKDEEGIRDTVLSWDFGIENETVSQKFGRGWVNINNLNAIPFFNRRNPSLDNIHSYLQNNPTRGEKEWHKDGHFVSDIEFVEFIAKASVKAGIGNCYEQSAIAFCLLLEHFEETDISIEWVGVDNDQGGDHQFIIANRDPRTDIRDLSTYNEDAIIIDPWFNACFLVGSYVAPNTRASLCKEYIACHQYDIEVEAQSYIGSGHSDRWIEHRNEKNEPVNFSEWVNENQIQKQPIPWFNV